MEHLFLVLLPYSLLLVLGSLEVLPLLDHVLQGLVLFRGEGHFDLSGAAVDDPGGEFAGVEGVAQGVLVYAGATGVNAQGRGSVVTGRHRVGGQDLWRRADGRLHLFLLAQSEGRLLFIILGLQELGLLLFGTLPTET